MISASSDNHAVKRLWSEVDDGTRSARQFSGFPAAVFMISLERSVSLAHKTCNRVMRTVAWHVAPWHTGSLGGKDEKYPSNRGPDADDSYGKRVTAFQSRY